MQILEDMLRDCILEFGGSWDAYLPLAEFAYNNSFQPSIQRALYKALYGRRYRSPIERFKDDKRRRDLMFTIGDRVFIQVSPMKGVMRFGKELSYIHLVFHVSMPKKTKCISDSSQVLEAPTIPLDEKLTYEEDPMVIVDRQVRKLQSKEIVVVEVLQKNHTIGEATWEVEDDI
ncbi:uncharacterized protein [Nicotiana sylvestris]|uniref:uncharacterized protein n=1 Tax=Nicotiana sylvestris TaxID=4096 RepID=UPI00388C3C47